jgi:predicted amidohydrolase YtcJ
MLSPSAALPRLALSLLPVLATACAGPRSTDTLYLGGPILTMVDARPEAEALLVRDGRIVAVGARAEVEAQAGARVRRVDLAGRVLVPGFVDSHGHASMVGLQAVSANLLPPPDGEGRSIGELQALLRDHVAHSPFVRQHGLVIGYNYDDSQLAEQRHPTRRDLDAVTTELPVIAVHQSGHLAVLNSLALERAGIGAETADPEGGVIRREADGRTPDGVLEENAMIAALLPLLPKFTQAQSFALLQAAQEIYASYGYTTVQEGRADPGTLAGLTAAAAAGQLRLDIVVYPDFEMNADNPALGGPSMARGYVDHLRLGGLKLSLDGSPQGKTAHFTAPYVEPPPGQPADYRGYATLTPERTTERLIEARRHGWQVIAHANGDAAIDQLIAGERAAQAAVPGADWRTVLIHGQFTRADQVDAIVELGIFPSLFPMHTFYWGDWHRTSVAGPERARDLSPTGWFLARGVPFAIHHDAPVTFPNSMRVLDSAVNRTTRSGFVLGPEHCLDPLVALKAMTLWPAYQHFEERDKGSLEPGKRADFVLLSADPRDVPRERLIELEVVETIKDGATVWRAQSR